MRGKRRRGKDLYRKLRNGRVKRRPRGHCLAGKDLLGELLEETTREITEEMDRLFIAHLIEASREAEKKNLRN